MISHTPHWLFKSDVSAAYHCWPMHPLWQLKQIVTIDGEQHVDRCMVFSSRSSPWIWCTFMGLITWIRIYVYMIEYLLHYMDNAFTYDTNPVLEYYIPHNTHYPLKQCWLLMLWDDIGLLHEQWKQVFGQYINIIGLFMNPIVCLSLCQLSQRMISSMPSLNSLTQHLMSMPTHWVAKAFRLD